jgi:hypothetical protein
MPGNYLLDLEKTPVSCEKTSVTLIYPNKKLRGYNLRQDYKTFTHERRGEKSWIAIPAKGVAEYLKGRGIKMNESVTVEVQYICPP